jgi:hypothetical protein
LRLLLRLCGEILGEGTICVQFVLNDQYDKTECLVQLPAGKTKVRRTRALRLALGYYFGRHDLATATPELS